MAGEKIKVLIADDEPEIGRVLQRFLTPKGYDVRVVDNGHDAIAEVQKDKPQVVLLDIQMPGIGGMETLTKIKEIDPQIVVIMVTAVKDESTGMEALNLGADDYITKPIDLNYLETSVFVKYLTKFH